MASTLDKFTDYLTIIQQEFFAAEKMGGLTGRYAQLYEYYKGISQTDKEELASIVAATQELIHQERQKLAQAMLARLSLHTKETLELAKEPLSDDIVLTIIRQLGNYGLSHEKFIKPFSAKSPEHKHLTPELIEFFKTFISNHGNEEQIAQLKNLLGEIKLQGHLLDSMYNSFLILPDEPKAPEFTAIVFTPVETIEDYKENLSTDAKLQFQTILTEAQVKMLEAFVDKYFVHQHDKLLFIDRVKNATPKPLTDIDFERKLTLAFKVTVLELLKDKSYEYFPNPDDKQLRYNFNQLAVFFANDPKLSIEDIRKKIQDTIAKIFLHTDFIFEQAKLRGYSDKACDKLIAGFVSICINYYCNNAKTKNKSLDDAISETKKEIDIIFPHSDLVFAQAKLCHYPENNCCDFSADYIINCIQDYSAAKTKNQDLTLETVISDNKWLIVELHCHSVAQKLNMNVKVLSNQIRNILDSTTDWLNDDKVLIQIIRKQKRLFTIKHELISTLESESARIENEKNATTSAEKTKYKVAELKLACKKINECESLRKIYEIVINMLNDSTLVQGRGIFSSLSLYNSTLYTTLTKFAEKLEKILTRQQTNVHQQSQSNSKVYKH